MVRGSGVQERNVADTPELHGVLLRITEVYKEREQYYLHLDASKTLTRALTRRLQGRLRSRPNRSSTPVAQLP